MVKEDNLYRYCVQERVTARRGLAFLKTGTVGEYVDGKFVDQTQESRDACIHRIAEAESVIALYE